MEVCKVCRKPVSPAERVTMGAFGRPLFIVHYSPCAGMVQTGAAAAARVALAAGRVALQRKAPGVYKLLEGATLVARRMHDGSQQPPDDA